MTTTQRNKTAMEFLSHWGLKDKPFENTGDPKFFYYSPTHKEALVRLNYVIRQRKSGALIAGDYGTGKTTIANELLAEIRETKEYHSVLISNPMLSPREMLQEIGFQLGVDKRISHMLSLRREIGAILKKILLAGRHTILIVDEAHLISRKDVLEELRLMMNNQYSNQYLSTLIIMGQLELRDIINAMPQFKQRFAMFYILKHLNKDECIKYIQHRINIAGADKEIFSPAACELIYNASYGRPRQINNICDMSLLVGSMNGMDRIEENIVRDVVRDLGEDV